MKASRGEWTKALEFRAGCSALEAKTLAGRILEIDDGEIEAALDAWIGGIETPLERGGISVETLVEGYGFTYPNACVCLAKDEVVELLRKWL